MINKIKKYIHDKLELIFFKRFIICLNRRFPITLAIFNRCAVETFPKGSLFPHPIGIVTSAFAKIGKNVVIYQNVTIGQKRRDKKNKSIKIGNNCIIYEKSSIYADIGNNCIIGSGCFIFNKIEDNTIVYNKYNNIIIKKRN